MKAPGLENAAFAREEAEPIAQIRRKQGDVERPTTDDQLSIESFVSGLQTLSAIDRDIEDWPRRQLQLRQLLGLDQQVAEILRLRSHGDPVSIDSTAPRSRSLFGDPERARILLQHPPSPAIGG